MTFQENYPFLLHWVWGHQTDIPPINLSTHNKKEIVFVAGSVGVCYDWINKKQCLLLGHKNNIVSIAASPDRRYLVTADGGEENVLIIWEAQTRSIFHVVSDYFPPEGVVDMCFSSDGNELMILSGGNPQEISIWDWKNKKIFPDLTFKYEEKAEYQHFVTFHSSFSSHFASCGKTTVYFFEKKEEKITSASLNIQNLYDDKTSNQIGIFTQTAFSNKSSLAVTATSKGMIVLWGVSLCSRKKSAFDSIEHLLLSPDQRVCIRIIQVLPSRCSIPFLNSAGDYLIIGTGKSELIYYDENFSIKWSKPFDKGQINNVSFCYKPKSSIKGAVNKFLGKKVDEDSPFERTDFIVCTIEGYVGYYSVSAKELQQILFGTNNLIKSIALHPLWSYVYFGDYNGDLQKWNYITKELLMEDKYLSSCSEIEVIAVDNKGAYIACGMSNGNLVIFDAVSFSAKPCFTADEILYKPTRMIFSPDSQHLLITDTSSFINHYRLQLLVVPKVYQMMQKGKASPEEPFWTYGGKSRQHQGRIVDCMFSDFQKNETLFFYTLGEDRFLVEYNISISKGLDIDVSKRIILERRPIPMCMTWYRIYDVSSLIGVLNNDGKMRVYCIETEKVVKVISLPAYEEPIERIIHQSKQKFMLKKEFPQCTDLGDVFQYFVFSCSHLIGLSKFPLDGNPNTSLALISFPNGINYIVLNKEQTFLFTAGLNDSWVYMYELNILAVLEAEKEGCDGIEAFKYLFPSECDPDDMKNKLVYSVYSLELEKKMLQFGNDEPSLEGEVPVEFLKYVLAAIGCFTTPNDLQLMLRDIEFENKYLYKGNKETLSSLDIMKLYVNYRPTEPVTRTKLKETFTSILALEEDPDQITRTRFIDILTTRGDALSHSELLKILKCLKNTQKSCAKDPNEFSSEDERKEADDSSAEVDAESELEALKKIIPEYINESAFFNDILCLEKSDEDLSRYILEEEDYKQVQEYPKLEDFVNALQNK